MSALANRLSDLNWHGHDSTLVEFFKDEVSLPSALGRAFLLIGALGYLLSRPEGSVGNDLR
jgi:hypothetical protein